LKLKSKIKIKISILEKKKNLGSQINCQKDLAIPVEKMVLMTKAKIKSHKQSSNKKISIMHIEKCVQRNERQPALISSRAAALCYCCCCRSVLDHCYTITRRKVLGTN
jgi:hypothetical protein